MNQNYQVYNWPKVVGPIATVLFTVVYYLGSVQMHYPLNGVWITLFVVLGTFVSGLRGGLLAAGWGSAFVIYAFDDWGRVIQVVPFLFVYASIIGWQTRRLRQAVLAEIEAERQAEHNRVAAEITDSMLNGNVRIFRQTIDILDGLRLGWTQIPDEARLKMVAEARAKLADLVTLAQGFKEMARQRGYVTGERDASQV